MVTSSNFHLPLKRYNGFTLLELLIAVSLSATLMLVLVVGLNAISRDWEKHGKQLDQKIDESLLLLQLEKAIIGTFIYSSKKNNIAKEELFFEGSSSELKWVSTVSPEQSSGLTLWHLQIKDDGGLLLTTLPVYPGSLNKQLEKYQSQNEKKNVYFKDYKISMFFLKESVKNKKQWVTNWAAKEKNKLPLGVRIEFTLAQDKKNELKSDWTLFGFIRVSSRNSTRGNAGRNSPFPSQSLPIDSDKTPGSSNNQPNLFK